MKIKQYKQYIIIIFIMIISIVIPFYEIKNIYIFQNKKFIDILFILFGFSLTSYVFIYSSAYRILDKLNDDALYVNITTLFKKLKENIILIFWMIVLILSVDIIQSIIINESKYLGHLLNSINILSFLLALYAIYDIIKVMFKIVRASFLIVKIKNK